MRRRATAALLPAGILAFATLVTDACSHPEAESAAPTPAPTVAVAKVTRGDLAQTLTVAAEFKPFQEIDVHAKVAGFVKSINVDVGDHVQAGQLIAVLEIPELQDEMQQDEAAIRRAQEEVKRAQADLERSRSAYDLAHLSATRLASVTKDRPNLIAQQDIDEATGRDRMADAQVATAKATLASSEQQLEIARAMQNKTKTLVAYTRITAPFAGIITRRYADTGAMIQAGTASQTQAMPLVKLSENSLLRLVIAVPESAVSRVRIGASVKVTVDTLRRVVPGKVARFASRLDSDTRTMLVEVDVPNANLELVPGMYASASLVLNEAPNVTIVPVEAIDHTGAQAQVLVVTTNRRIEPRTLTLGLETADRVEVKAGLAPDDLVVIGNRAQLKAGAQVTPKVIAAVARGEN